MKSKKDAAPEIATKSPGDFELASLESRVAARALAERRKHCGIRLSICYIGQERPADEPKPKHRNGFIEYYYCDDDDWPED